MSPISIIDTNITRSYLKFLFDLMNNFKDPLGATLLVKSDKFDSVNFPIGFSFHSSSRW